MQAHVNGHGDVTHIDVIRSIPVLTDVAVAALGAWKFTEAQSKETADVSPRIAIVVISFQSPEYPGYPISAGSSMAKDAGPSR
jgi:hypothetical protein